MNRAVVFCFLLAFLGNSLLKDTDAQATNVRSSWDVIKSLDSLTKSVQNLETKVQIQVDLLNKTLITEQQKQDTCFQNFKAEEEWQQAVAQYTSNRTIVALIGDDVEIWCVAAETLLSQIKWKRQNGMLKLDRVQYANHRKTLQIKNLEMTDAGTYVCDAANDIGSPISHSINLEVYAKAQQCHTLIESDKGNFEIETLSTGCLLVIKLENTTGFRLQLHPHMTEPILVIPEPNLSNSNFQSVGLFGSKNVSHTFEGKILAVVVPPGRERTTLNWSGLGLDDSGVLSSTEFKNDSEGWSEWEPAGEGTHKLFWAFEREMTEQLSWALNISVDQTSDPEHPCKSISFAVLEIRLDGNVNEIEKTCDGSSLGYLMSESSSQVLLLLHVKSVKEAKPRLEVSWKHHPVPLKKNVEGILAGTQGIGVVVVPFSSSLAKNDSSTAAVHGLAFDWNSRRIYRSQSGVGIMRSNLDGSESTTLLSDASSSLYGLAIEPINGNFYYANRTSKTIRVCSNDGTRCSLIANSSLSSSIDDIAVHSSKGLLFWSSWDSKLVRANLDGSNLKILLDGLKIRRLDVDEQGDRLYWGTEEGIRSCELDGRDVQTVPNLSANVVDVATDGDKVYYSHYSTHSIHSTSKSGMSASLVQNLTSYSYNIALYGTRISNPPINPCVKSRCAHLCVVMSPSTYRCMCPENQKLNIDGQTCQP